jgi:hypothetical protein
MPLKRPGRMDGLRLSFDRIEPALVQTLAVVFTFNHYLLAHLV